MAEIATQPMYAGGPMTAADWTAQNPRLEPFQMGLEKDPATGAITKAKIGTPARAHWNDLEYFSPSGAGGTLDDTVAYCRTFTVTLADLQSGGPELNFPVRVHTPTVSADGVAVLLDWGWRVTQSFAGPGLVIGITNSYLSLSSVSLGRIGGRTGTNAGVMADYNSIQLADITLDNLPVEFAGSDDPGFDLAVVLEGCNGEDLTAGEVVVWLTYLVRDL
jgi:hypothetical protein